MKKILKNMLYACMTIVMVSLSSCDNENVLIDNQADKDTSKKAIVFGNNLPVNSTRASLTPAGGFPDGSVISVYGFQTTGAAVDQNFKDQAVTKGGEKWTYSPVKYWNLTSTYEFYAVYPKDKISHTFNNETKMFAIDNFVVADDKDAQIDVMIAEKNTTSPLNIVNFNFNHLLSNVNFYFKTINTFDFNGIASIEVVEFDVEGICNKGSYQQTGNVEGTWTASTNGADIYDFPKVTSGSVSDNTSHTALATDLLLLPQSLASADKKITMTYRINYSDGTAARYTKSVALSDATFIKSKNGATSEDLTVWKPNYIYNYFLAVNPAILPNGDSAVIEFTATVDEWQDEIDAEIEVK